MKKTYTKPSMEKIGAFESVTKAGNVGSFSDATFPDGTPFDEFTFS